MSKQKVVLIRTDNWEMIFVKGKCKYSGHRPRTQDVLKAIGVSYASTWVDEFPDNLEYVRKLDDVPSDILDDLE